MRVLHLAAGCTTDTAPVIELLGQPDLAREDVIRLRDDSIRRMRAGGFSVSVVGLFFGLTPQRVSQITRAGN